MKSNVIAEAIANIASTSAVLEKYSSDPKNYNVMGTELLERMSWELQKQSDQLRELQYMYGF
jgi:hypothetical protein